MKMRAFPQSFWQQPNVAHNVSPAQNYPLLPPLVTKDGEESPGEIVVKYKNQLQIPFLVYYYLIIFVNCSV